MNELKKIIEQGRAVWNKLPLRARFIAAVALLATVGGVTYSALRGPTEEYAVLFAGLQTEDAARVVAELKAQNVLYRLDAGGATIEVPAAKVHELRLAMASAGLPRGGGVGFELFDKQTFGTTSFVEQLNYRRALQGELARTVMSLDGVERARVHVAVPERSLYKDEDEPPSASVVVTLKPGHRLSSTQVRGVVHLMASSVPGLKPERITLVDEAGAPLWSGEEMTAEAGAELERTLARRVRDMIERVVGAGHASVVVTAELDESRQERTEESYDKDKAAIRSESRTEERSDGAGSAGGVAGARGNLPGAAAPSAGAPEAGRVRLSETKNYELNHVVSRVVQPHARVKRLHVAVLVDEAVDKKGKHVPRPAEELARITALARTAAGLEDERGDKIEVATAPFVDSLGDGTQGAATPVLPRWAPYAAGAGALVAMLVAAAFVARRRRPLRAELLPALPAPVGHIEATLTQPGATPALGAGGNNGTARTRVLEAARRDAPRAARVVSAWLNEANQENPS